MSKILSMAAVIVAISAVSASDAFAQRGRDPLGIGKPYYGSGAGGGMRSGMGGGMRGGMGRGMMGQSYSYAPRPSGSFYSQPAPLAYEPSYRVFSFEPIGINPGDTVVVNRDAVKLMQGRNVVGEIPAGLQFRVTKVINGWLGAVVEVNGQQQKGWIWNRHVRLAEEAPPAPPSGT